MIQEIWRFLPTLLFTGLTVSPSPRKANLKHGKMARMTVYNSYSLEDYFYGCPPDSEKDWYMVLLLLCLDFINRETSVAKGGSPLSFTQRHRQKEFASIVIKAPWNCPGLLLLCCEGTDDRELWTVALARSLQQEEFSAKTSALPIPPQWNNCEPCSTAGS